MEGECKGIQLTVPSVGEVVWPRRLLAAAFFVSLLLTVDALLDLSPWPPSLLIGVGIVLSVSLLEKRGGLLSVLAAALILVPAALVWLAPAAAAGGRMLCARLFQASEAVNRYAYSALALPDAEEAARAAGLIRLLLACAGGGAALLAGFGRLHLWPVLIGAALALAEAFFGVTAGGVELAAFALAALLLWLRIPLGHRSSGGLCLLLAGLCVGLAVLALMPGVDQRLEERSERLRDLLEPSPAVTLGMETAEKTETAHTRHESRLNELELPETEDSRLQTRDYEGEREEQEDISLPETTDLRRILRGLLLVLLIFLLPFLPFFLLDRRRKRLLARRAAFHAGDPAAAIRSMLPHIAACLASLGLGEENANYSALVPLLEERLSPVYAARYREGVELWQEAAYSTHRMEETQREQVYALLRETEKEICQLADRKQRLRLRYWDCLIGPEEDV